MIAESRSLLRVGLLKIVEDSSDIGLVGEASNCAEAVRMVHNVGPDVTVVGYLEDYPEPLSAIRKIGAFTSSRSSRFLALSDPPGPSQRDQLGAVGMLLTNTDPAGFCAAIRMLSAGYSFLPPVQEFPMGHQDRKNGAGQDNLTKRELDVLHSLARGQTNAETSRELSLSESTVKSHVQNLLSKLHLRNRVAAVIYAYETGLIKTGRFTGTATRPRGRVEVDSAESMELTSH